VSDLAKELGSKRNAGWLILGGTKASGKEASGKRFVAEATMVVRVVNTSDGRIIASEEGTKSVEETSQETALSEAAASVARAVGENISVQISRYLQPGSILALNLYKVSDAQISLAFQKFLKSLAGVTRVEQLNFDGINGLLELSVTFRG